ncbi:carboxypeptidase-like regulatory domain-containing protein [Hymenobacter sp. J193]|uniref:carboxypeptidase-like regulatory domain-containing protein n=1 Tax=Hymenobacter sp. J193 TaxID=2898429 RepID=UPI002150AE01|nr:carboxypeptidase-like regulatory domain-containing protein [Hymenobacter sp. J193]MCR5887919.1 carboxypeptidase-like regulatory domain-containing protein [Hymenobacter sp. J193]
MHRASTLFLGLGLLLAPGMLLAQQSAPEPVAASSQAVGCPIVTGTVTDEDNNPLTGATVQVPGLMDAFITNSEGHYMIMTKAPLQKTRG